MACGGVSVCAEMSATKVLMSVKIAKAMRVRMNESLGK
jgi:hypothetical protein